MKNIINFIVKEDDNNKRVDIILANHDKSLSRTRVKNLILNRKLKINERIVQDPSIKTKLNDNIELEIIEPKKQSLKPYEFIFKDNTQQNTTINLSNIQNYNDLPEILISYKIDKIEFSDPVEPEPLP